MTADEAKVLRTAPLATPTDLKPNAVRDLAGALNILLADTFGLYLKTKNFHWHVSGPHFRDYHLLLDEQGDQIFATTDAIAERAVSTAFERSAGVAAILAPALLNDVERKLKLLRPMAQKGQLLNLRSKRSIPRSA
jgi:starvation-inducible DNA-binding protein